MGWLLLGYGVPLALITGSYRDRGLRFVTGMWFLWVVAIQSVAVAAANLAPHADLIGLPIMAAVCWSIGSLLSMPAHTVLPESVILGMSFVQWAFCTWLVPLLVGLGVWRHVVRRYPLTYETALWGMVFPIGMYGVASYKLGKASGTDGLAAFGGGEGWIATAVWLAVFIGMCASARKTMRRRKAKRSRDL